MINESRVYRMEANFILRFLKVQSIQILNLPILVLKSIQFKNNVELEKLIIENFSLSWKNFNEYRYHTLILYMMNHLDYNHLISNLLSFSMFSFSLVRTFSNVQIIKCYFGGGIFGAICVMLEYFIQNNSFKNKPSRTFRNHNLLNTTNNSPIIGFMSSIMDRTFNYVNQNKSIIGCSGGVAALMGLHLCYSLMMIQDLIAKYNKYRNNPNVTNNGLLDLPSILMNSSMMFESIKFVTYSFVHSIKQIDNNRGIFNSLMAYSLDGTAHWCHLGGFIFGCMYYFVGSYMSIRRTRK